MATSIASTPPVRFPARALLRSATEDAHARVDAAFGRFDLGTRAGYRTFLLAQAAAHLPVEEALDSADAGGVIPDWPARRRAGLLRADLAALDAPVPDRGDIAVPDDAASIAGMVYVLEGSRLGGAMLRTRVAPGSPLGFLAAPAPPGSWRALLARLDEVLADPPARERATGAARATFALFEEAARG